MDARRKRSAIWGVLVTMTSATQWWEESNSPESRPTWAGNGVAPPCPMHTHAQMHDGDCWGPY